MAEPSRLHHFDIKLFGPARILRDGQPIHPPAPQGLTFWSALVLNGGSLHRNAAAAMLWPDAGVSVARERLHQLVHRLRRQLDASIVSMGAVLMLRDSFTVDIEDFILAATRALSGVDGRLGSFQTAIWAQQLWVGAPLEANRFDAWAMAPRKRCYLLQEQLWDMLSTVNHESDWPPENVLLNNEVSGTGGARERPSFLGATSQRGIN